MKHGMRVTGGFVFTLWIGYFVNNLSGSQSISWLLGMLILLGVGIGLSLLYLTVIEPLFELDTFSRRERKEWFLAIKTVFRAIKRDIPVLIMPSSVQLYQVWVGFDLSLNRDMVSVPEDQDGKEKIVRQLDAETIRAFNFCVGMARKFENTAIKQ